jgi:hypothetical protein
MGTAHGAEELGLCSHGLACQAGAWGRYSCTYKRRAIPLGEDHGARGLEYMYRVPARLSTSTPVLSRRGTRWVPAA